MPSATSKSGENATTRGSLGSVVVTWCRTGVVLSLLCSATVAAAQDTGGDKPWYEDTTLAQREQARAIFLEGNRLLNVPSFARAAEEYKRAIEIWGHPAFYYNLVIAQLSLVKPIEAYASVKQALRYGPVALGEDKHTQALTYKKLLEEQLAKVVIRCDEPGVEVTLDGKHIFTGPGEHEEVLLPGTHQVVGSKPERVTETQSLVLSAGEDVEMTLVLAIPDRIGTKRHFPAWIPWLALSAGVAVVSTAGYLDWDASQELDRFDQSFNARCRRGCIDDQVPDLASRLQAAEGRKTVALGLYMAGGAMVVGSAILVYMNRERVIRTKITREELSVTPLVTPDSAGVAARLRF